MIEETKELVAAGAAAGGLTYIVCNAINCFVDSPYDLYEKLNTNFRTFMGLSVIHVGYCVYSLFEGKEDWEFMSGALACNALAYCITSLKDKFTK
ncbi:hypothetical protein ACFL1H_06335 [Nanoarchaeota archaeon]